LLNPNCYITRPQPDLTRPQPSHGRNRHTAGTITRPQPSLPPIEKLTSGKEGTLPSQKKNKAGAWYDRWKISTLGNKF